MDFLIVLGSAALLFLVLPTVLKSNAAFAFLALCSGELLSSLAGSDATNIARSVLPMQGDNTSTIVHIALLGLPAVITILLFKDSLKTGKLFVNIIPGICATVLATLLVVEKLPFSIQNTATSEAAYIELSSYRVIALVVGMASTLLLLYFERPSRKKHSKSSH